VPRFERLVAAMIDADRRRDGRVRMVRELVAGFRGLSGTAKQKTILAELGLARASLEDLVGGDGALDRDLIERLLGAMRTESKAPKAEALGIIGKDHLLARLELDELGEDSFTYRKLSDRDPLSPRVVETAFAFDRDLDARALHCGLNHSPALSDVGAFAMLGADGLGALLRQQRVEAHHPVVVLLHLAGARLEFTDRGTSSLAWSHRDDLNSGAAEDFKKITDRWRKHVQREERDANARALRINALVKQRTVSAKEAAWEVMKKAYMAASDNGGLPATARQIMYAARDDIQQMTGKKLSDTYFTKTLLPLYITENRLDWDVVWESRGTFSEPHTGRHVPVGTLPVREYLAGRESCHLPAEQRGGRWHTQGAKDRFGAVLYLEKEGFWPLFRAVQLAARFDIALMSSKGTSTTEARKLVDAMAAEGVPAFCVRDFDLKGFEIAGTLCRDTWRYTWRGKGAIDLGLRLEDVTAWDLPSEEVFYQGPEKRPLDPVKDRAAILAKIEPSLRKYGATEEEIEFLVTRRVELNVFPAKQLVRWIEGKLEAHGVQKVVPAEETLVAAARGFARDAIAERYLAFLADDLDREVDAFGPGDIAPAVAAMLAENPAMPWDEAVELIVRRNATDKDTAGGEERQG
jgi:hypothetical protein